jgi:hypothetical protein
MASHRNSHNYDLHKLHGGAGYWRVHLSGQMVCDMYVDGFCVAIHFVGNEKSRKG